MIDVERMTSRVIRVHPALLIGSGVAAGLLLSGLLGTRRRKRAVDIVFEPEEGWTELRGGDGDGPSSDGRAHRVAPADEVEEDDIGLSDDIGLTDDVELEGEARWGLDGERSVREMTPDIENISAEHPSEPPPRVAGRRD
jgi:hypothetical protein